ncbi:hypothetical protein FB451DRAFT_1162645 [Mycena latifolia]|nr:hypothetical protein FB451DRAFT_1162645 [Mycena latifolia]
MTIRVMPVYNDLGPRKHEPWSNSRIGDTQEGDEGLKQIRACSHLREFSRTQTPVIRASRLSSERRADRPQYMRPGRERVGFRGEGSVEGHLGAAKPRRMIAKKENVRARVCGDDGLGKDRFPSAGLGDEEDIAVGGGNQHSAVSFRKLRAKYSGSGERGLDVEDDHKSVNIRSTLTRRAGIRPALFSIMFTDARSEVGRTGYGTSPGLWSTLST